MINKKSSWRLKEIFRSRNDGFSDNTFEAFLQSDQHKLAEFSSAPQTRIETLIEIFKDHGDPLNHKILKTFYPDSYLKRLKQIFSETSFATGESSAKDNSPVYDNIFSKIASLPVVVSVPNLFYKKVSAQARLKVLKTKFSNVPEIQDMCEDIVGHIYDLAEKCKKYQGNLFLRELSHPDKIKPLIFLLTGPPGVGKTFCVRLISQVLEIPIISIDAIGNDYLSIMGSCSRWKNADCGAIAGELIINQTFPCIMLLDEIDKGGSTNNHDFVYVVNRITDPEKVFMDHFLEVELYHLRTFVIILTANDSSVIPKYIKSRAFEVNIKEVDTEKLIQSIVEAFLNHHVFKRLKIDNKEHLKECLRLGFQYLEWDFRKAISYLNKTYKTYKISEERKKKSFLAYLEDRIRREIAKTNASSQHSNFASLNNLNAVFSAPWPRNCLN